MSKKITIDIVSDVICPWCFLGKRRLDKALANVADIDVTIRWHPFMLDASLPPEGMDRTDYLTRKFVRERLATLHDPLAAAGKAEGLPYRFDLITRTPNTLDAHRVIRWAAEAGKQHDMAERLFSAYWIEGRDIGDRTVLKEEAARLGLDAEEIGRRLENGTDSEAVMADIRQAYEIGINGVPTFILAQRYGVSGAQEPALLEQAIRKAAA